ncbi:alpha/beta fold hydrolase [Pseudonocardia sp. CA-142604]|uniref:alpha/beta fold hydrolase n=1 Tax=Pseudonocardia sp. CA-142604 TaxID=3240024 RepID=UPI003D89FDFB
MPDQLLPPAAAFGMNPDSVDGPVGPIAYRRTGRGHPLVLLHSLALDGRMWGPYAARLAPHFDVIAPDARGHGGSGWDGGPFDTADLAADLAALLDGLGLPSAHVLGMSMGGSVAIEFAGTHQARVDRLVLADTTAWYGETARGAWTERAERAVALPRRRQVPFQVDRWFTERFRRTRHDEVRRIAGIFVETDSGAHAEASLALGRLDARHLLAGITAPTLSVTGEEDYATPVPMGREIAEGVADGRHRTLSGLRHLSLVERPDLAGLVRAHLDGAEPAEPDSVGTCCLAGAAGHAAVVA